jgi:hypothetical protein
LEPDRDARRALHDVLVGQNVALRIDYETAADAVGRTPRLAAKHIKQRIAGRLVFVVVLVAAAALGHLRRCRLGIDLDDGRFDAFRDLGEGG